MHNLVIFGERPGPNTDPSRPLFPHTATGAAARLIEMLGISRDDYLAITRYNAVDNRHTTTAHPEVRLRLCNRIRFHRLLNPEVRILFLGRAAAHAGPRLIWNLPFGQVYDNMMVIPHPSGRNRYYNSQASKEFIVQALRKFAGTL